MRVLGIVCLMLTVGAGAGWGGEDGGAAPPFTDAEAIGLLRSFAKHQCFEDPEEAWALFEVDAFTQRALGRQLEAADSTVRSEAVALMRTGLLQAFEWQPFPWASEDAVLADYQVTRSESGFAVAHFSWERPNAGLSGRWGVVLRPDAGGAEIVDFIEVRGAATVLSSAIVAYNYAAMGDPDLDVRTFLRGFFRIPIPESVVPEDAAVDWASPDLLALAVEPPVVPEATPDGWFAFPSQAPPGVEPVLLHRYVLNVLADGTLVQRHDPERWGGAKPLSRGVILPDQDGPRITDLHYGPEPVLVRADRRTPWKAIRFLVGSFPPWVRDQVAFSVRRDDGSGAPSWGQLGLAADHEVPVAASGRQLQARGGFPPPTPTPFAAEGLTVRLEARPGEDGSLMTWIQVADRPPVLLPPSEGRERRMVLRRVTLAVGNMLASSGQRHVTLCLPSPEGDDVTCGDVLETLGVLRRLPGCRIAISMGVTQTFVRSPDGADMLPEVDVLVASTLTWTTPPGWIERSEWAGGFHRDMRIAPSEDSDAECWAVIVEEDEERWMANARRWHEELGVITPEAEALKNAPTVEACGRASRFFEIQEVNAPDEREANWIYAVVCRLERSTLYVKMSGPRSELEPRRGEFVDLCRSLRVR